MEETKERGIELFKQLNQDAIGGLIEGMNDSLGRCKQVTAEYQTDAEGLAALDYKDLKRMERDLSSEIKNADEARKTFKREWQKPQKMVEEAFAKELAAAKELHAAYKAERVARDEESREKRIAALRELYADYAPEFGELVKFESVFEDKWANASFGQVKAEEALCEKVRKLLEDWNTLNGLDLEYAEAARAKFVDTLDLGQSVAENRRLVENEAKAKAKERAEEEFRAAQAEAFAKAAQMEAQEQNEAETAPEEAVPDGGQDEQVPVEHYAAEEQYVTEFSYDGPAAFPVVPLKRYRFEVECTESEAKDLVRYFKDRGIHGSFAEVK